jgi:hypothetical protein
VATDYHSKPLLSCRVPAESLDWARGEAERRGEAFGDFMDGLIAAERDRVNHVVDPAPVFLAAEDEQPEPARRNCKHRNMRGVKGVCPDCKEWVSPAASRTNGGES